MNYKKLQFTEKGNLLFNNIKFNNNDDYYKYNKNKQILMDMEMYIDEIYTENKFLNLDEFSLSIAFNEYQDPQIGKKEISLKINKAINKGWVKIIS